MESNGYEIRILTKGNFADFLASSAVALAKANYLDLQIFDSKRAFEGEDRILVERQRVAFIYPSKAYDDCRFNTPNKGFPMGQQYYNLSWKDATTGEVDDLMPFQSDFIGPLRVRKEKDYNWNKD